MSHTVRQPDSREAFLFYDYPIQNAAHQTSKSEQSHEEEVASFLLSLKHNNNQRSITPEPAIWSSEKAISSSLSDYHQVTPILSSHQQSSSGSYSSSGPVDLERLVHSSNSLLVALDDVDLIPDALFLAMAQMKPTLLAASDRVGCYKTRPIGYLGMCCKHCNGQPGFGRYFPNSVRSLAQTTTSQTILKHIGNKCSFCPDHIRKAVLQLQHEQDQRESAGRPRYGSRKVFFQRVWTRLHSKGVSGSCSSYDVEDHHMNRHIHVTSMGKEDDNSSSQTPSDIDEDTSVSTWPSADADDKAKA